MTRRTRTVRIKARTLAEVKDFVTGEIPRAFRGVFVEATAGALVIELRKAPAYSYVMRATAYGQPFFSERQRRFIMASIRAGKNLKTGSPMEPGYPHRTGNTIGRPGQDVNSGPGFHTEKRGVQTVIVNAEPGAKWIVAPGWQARQPKLAGWQTADVTIQQNLDNAMLDGIDAVVDEMEKRKNG